MFTVTVDESAPGTGKTYSAILRAVLNPSRYLFVTERLESIVELEQRVRLMARDTNRNPKITTILRDTAERGFSVRQEVEALPEKYGEAEHVIAICTHAAMLMSDFSAFTGWHIVVDEVPAVLDSEEVMSMLDVPFFSDHYRLEPLNEQWSAVTLTEQGRTVDGSQLSCDYSHNHLRVFHRRVTDASSGRENARPVICNLQSWEQMAQPKTAWIWGSLFGIRQLEAFDSVTFLGNGFNQSLAAKLMQGLNPEVVWTTQNTTRSQPFAHRRVRVCYFSESHNASKTFLDSDEGKANLRAISRYVAGQIEPGKFIWSCNEFALPTLASHLPRTDYKRPKQAGADNLMHCSQALMIYSAKPTPNVEALIQAFRISRQDWVSSNEFEIILQFVTRTSIRSLDNGQDVTVWVYDAAQARYLMNYLATLGHVTAEVEFIDLGLNEARSRGRPKTVLTPEEAEAIRQEKKRKKAEADRKRNALRRAA